MRWTDPIGRLGGAVYDFGVEREWLARRAGRILWGTDTSLLYREIRALGDLPDGAALLDVPCGGGIALRGTRPGIRYVAVDLSPAMLGRTRRRAARLGRRIETVEADITHLPLTDAEFDVCVCFNGLHCLPDPAAAVGELARCLKPGGRLVGDTIVVRAGLRQDVAISLFQRAGLFGTGGTATDLLTWLEGADLRVDRLEVSGAVAHFAATR